MTALLIALMLIGGLVSIAIAAPVAVQHWIEIRRIEAARRQAIGR